MSGVRVIQKIKPGAVDGSVDHYVLRLAQANQRFAVTARTDLRDANGVRLVRSGQTINAKVADSVMNHQLVFGQSFPTPIDQIVEFERCIDGQLLFHKTYALFGKHADLMAMLRRPAEAVRSRDTNPG